MWVADRNRVVHLSSTGAQLWRSTAGAYPYAVIAADATDGSCWVLEAGVQEADHPVIGQYYNSVVTHISASGVILWRSRPNEFADPWSLCVNPSDGTYWVADTDHNQVVRLRPLNFSDVPSSFWAYEEIMASAEDEVVQGYEDGTYQPEGAVTREQMAAFIARCLAGPGLRCARRPGHGLVPGCANG